MAVYDVMMYNNYVHRTQILLQERQYAALRAWGRRLDKGLSELIRMAVDRLLREETQTKRGPSKLDGISGIGVDKEGFSGRDHDQTLYAGRRGGP